LNLKLATEQEKEGKRSKTMQQEIMGKLRVNEVVGFMNHNGLDYQRSNLKVMTRREVNQHMRIPRTSKYHGVSYNESLRKMASACRERTASKMYWPVQ
jgi:hypothetical protein